MIQKLKFMLMRCQQFSDSLELLINMPWLAHGWGRGYVPYRGRVGRRLCTGRAGGGYHALLLLALLTLPEL